MKLETVMDWLVDCPLHGIDPLTSRVVDGAEEQLTLARGSWWFEDTSVLHCRLNGNLITSTAADVSALFGVIRRCMSPVLFTVDGLKKMEAADRAAGDRLTAA